MPRTQKDPQQRKLRIAFLHPDLGLGGAERLVVDAAAGLAHLGHDVTMFTSHYDPARSFAETRDGTFRVRVYGDWLPRHILGAFFVLFAILRNVYLAAVVALTAPHYDVFVADQVSACVPLLRLLRPRAAVVFYLHFPDLLLSERKSAAKRAYRLVFDWFEEATTGCAHDIVVNSGFTRDKFMETFKTLARRGRQPAVLYPCIAIADAPTAEPQSSPRVLLSINRYERKKDIGLAIRAFAAFLQQEGGRGVGGAHLVVAGGYDPRLAENVEHYVELKQLALQEGLMQLQPQPGPDDALSQHRGSTASPSGSSSRRRGPPPPAAVADTAAAGDGSTAGASAVSAGGGTGMPEPLSTDAGRVVTAWPGSSGSGGGGALVESFARVTFIRSFSDAQKRALLASASAVLYTPGNEHFGIVPIESMAAARPVIAVASGGPLESVLDGETGFLCEPTPAAFAGAIASVLRDAGRARAMGAAGRTHVLRRFSRDAFARALEELCAAQVERVQAGRGASFGL